MLSVLDDAARFKAKFVDDNDHKFFVDGLGDGQGGKLKDDLEQTGEAAFKDIELVFEEGEKATSTQTIAITRASFASPASDYFPEENVGVGEVEMVMPRAGSSNENQLKGIVLLLPMTGDMGFVYRRKNIAMPLAELGYGSISLMQAFYGKRMPSAQVQYYVRTCNDFALSIMSAFLEGTKLLKWIQANYPGIPVGVSGLSLGGVSAAAVATFFQGNLAVIPCCAANSADTAFESGPLRAMVSTSGFNDPSVQKACFEFLGELKISELMKAKKVRGEHSEEQVIVTRFVRANRDKFIPQRDSVKLASVLEGVSTQFDLIKVSGGHLSTILYSTKYVVPQVVLAFESLNACVVGMG